MPRTKSGNARPVKSLRLGFAEGLAVGTAINRYNESADKPITMSDVARMGMAEFCRAQGVMWPSTQKEPT